MQYSQQQQPQADDTDTLHVVLTAIPTEHMSPTELEDLEHDLLMDLFLDYNVPYTIVKAMREVDVTMEDLLNCENLPRLLELLRSEQNLDITEGVAEQIKETIAYATMPLEQLAQTGTENATH